MKCGLQYSKELTGDLVEYILATKIQGIKDLTNAISIPALWNQYSIY